MQIILTLHFPNSFYEIFLPGVDNRRIDVRIPNSISGAFDEMTLVLEIWNGAWFLSGGRDISLEQNETKMDRVALYKDQML